MAKFKVGDRVVSIKTGRKGKIVAPGGRYNMYGHYGHHEMWNVWFDDEKEMIPVLMGSEEIRLANSRACNASAKIVTTGNFGTLKVGDRVDFRKSRYWRGTGVVTKVYGDGIIDVKGDNGEGEMEIHEEDIMNSRVRSTNAVVAKALNATYKLSSTEAKVGDKVKVAGALGTYIVTKVDGDWIYIEDANDGTQHGRVAARFATVANACGTARNADADDSKEFAALKNKWEPRLKQAAKILNDFLRDTADEGWDMSDIRDANEAIMDVVYSFRDIKNWY